MARRFEYANLYWRSVTAYKWVAVIEYIGDGPYFTTSVAASNDLERLKRKMQAYDNQSRYRYWIIDKTTYNAFRTHIKQNNLGNDFDVDAYLEEQMRKTNLPALAAPSLKDQVVHMAWNMTTGQVVAIDPTRDVVTRAAEEVARNNPTNQILILAPVSKVYQPVQIKNDPINLSELNGDAQI